LVVFLWLGALLDDLVNQLANFGLQPDFAALRADERRGKPVSLNLVISFYFSCCSARAYDAAFTPVRLPSQS
jgi:hypothetical protein